MSCFERLGITKEEMAEKGISHEEIELLELEIKLAREKAKIDAYDAGMTKAEQEQLMDLAELDARRIAHDRHHRKMADEERQFFAQLARLKHKIEVH